MYRQYEDARALQEQYDKAEARYNECVESGEYDDGYLYDMYCDLQELKERINFAWQDEEFEEDYRRENYGDCYPDGDRYSWEDNEEDDEFIPTATDRHPLRPVEY